jgi:hypothetical protein
MHMLRSLRHAFHLRQVGLSALTVIVFCASAYAAPPTVGFTAIAVRNNVGQTRAHRREGDGSPSRAIDGNFATATYLTTSGTSTAASRSILSRSGIGEPCVRAALEQDRRLCRSAQSGDLCEHRRRRAHQPSLRSVTNLSNGYFGTETMNGVFAATPSPATTTAPDLFNDL